MAIILPNAPPEGLEIVRSQALALLSAAPYQTRMRAMADATDEVNVTQPHRVFFATVDDVWFGRVLANAREATWRYFLVHNQNEPFATAEISGNELSEVNEGPFVQGSVAAMLAAEQLQATRERNWELRLLRIPALFTVAVWLTTQGSDILIPAEPAPEGLTANSTYDEASFTSALRPLAQLRSQPDDLRG